MIRCFNNISKHFRSDFYKRYIMIKIIKEIMKISFLFKNFKKEHNRHINMKKNKEINHVNGLQRNRRGIRIYF